MLIKFLLNGKEINLTSDNVVIESNNFKVDKDGNMTCNNAYLKNVDINGGNIDLDSNSTVRKIYIHNEAAGGNVEIYYDGIDIRERGSRAQLNYGGLLLEASEGTTDDYAYIGPNYARINGTVYAKEFLNLSLENKKKNFEKLENALDIIKKVDIYKYNFKSEKDTDKKHLGFVIGDNYKYSKELTSKENDGADIYSLASCCLQAIKEQQKTIENLQNEIKELKESRS